MKCPLMSHKTVSPFTPGVYEVDDCLKEECAWWLEETDRCAVLEIAAATCAVAEHLSVIREYGPGQEPERK